MSPASLAAFLFASMAVFAEGASVGDCPEDAARNAYARNLTSLTAVGRFVEARIVGKDFAGKLISKEEQTFLKNNPEAAIMIRNSACRAAAISYSVCGIDLKKGEYYLADEEGADAIRHFAFSTYLSCARGKDFAERYTVAHEQNPDDWNESNKMDIHNNYVAFEWADPRFERCKTPDLDYRMTKAALDSWSTDLSEPSTREKRSAPIRERSARNSSRPVRPVSTRS